LTLMPFAVIFIVVLHGVPRHGPQSPKMFVTPRLSRGAPR